MRRVLTLAASAALLTGLSACGGNDADEAREVVEAFYASSDGEEACALVHPSFQPILGEGVGGNCVEAIDAAPLAGSDVTIEKVEVQDSRASVQVTIEDPGIADRVTTEVRLVNEDGDWLIIDTGLQGLDFD